MQVKNLPKTNTNVILDFLVQASIYQLKTKQFFDICKDDIEGKTCKHKRFTKDKLQKMFCNL